MKKGIMTICVAVLSINAYCADKATASAMAKGAAMLAELGKVEKAKDMCYKALAFDSDCPEALYELGKLFEKEGNKMAASDFLTRAAQGFGSEDAASPESDKKRRDAETRAQRLNPSAKLLANAFADYIADLNAIVKKAPDPWTLEEAYDRVDQLQLKIRVPPERGPKFERPIVKQSDQPIMPQREIMISEVENMPDNPAPVVPPDIERVLKDPKQGGWDIISGTWKMKGANIYEVSDGILEAKKVNGTLSCTFHKEGSSGKIRMLVRNNEPEDGDIVYEANGFGFAISKDNVRFFTPISFFGRTDYVPNQERNDPLPQGSKVHFAVFVENGKLDYRINGVSKKKTGQLNISRTGSMILQIKGTVIVELPQAQEK